MKNTITLKKNYEFEKLLKKGVYFRSNLLLLYVLDSKTDYNKIGFIVSKKAGKSVLRNRIRRLMRQAYSDFENDIVFGKSFLIMWKTKNTNKDPLYIDIKEDVRYLLKESGILK